MTCFRRYVIQTNLRILDILMIVNHFGKLHSDGASLAILLSGSEELVAA